MNKYIVFIGLLCAGISQAQERVQIVEMSSDSVQVEAMKNNVKNITWNTDPLSPAKAAFYSAVLPGLGQIYNKSYWKLPLVYAAVGTPIYFYIINSKEYNRYPTAYKSADGQPRLSTDGLRRGIQFYRRNKELSILIGIGLYALNIIDANVEAHLKQFNVDERLSVQPYIQADFLTQPQYGLSITYKSRN